MQNLIKSQLILAITVPLLGILVIINNLKEIKQDKRIRCLEFGMQYVGDDFCSNLEPPINEPKLKEII